MILAKEFLSMNVRKAQRKALNSSYTYSIFDISMPLKMYKNNLKTYSLHDNHEEIGVILQNSSFLNKRNNHVLFDKKKALAQSFQNQIIIKLHQPDDWAFVKWMHMIEPYVLGVAPSFIMIPINNSLNISIMSDCILAIQELNSILLSFAFTSEIVFYQRKETISSLAYLIHNVGFPSKTSLCLNIDDMESNYYTLKDIRDDIIKYELTNKVSMIKTNKYSVKNAIFKEFLNILPEDIIVFGDKI